jgi:hypothetical protein
MWAVPPAMFRVPESPMKESRSLACPVARDIQKKMATKVVQFNGLPIGKPPSKKPGLWL